LFSAPTMLYVVLLVTLMHQAVVYEIPTAAAPEKAMAIRRKVLVSWGKFLARLSCPQSSMTTEHTTKTGTHKRLL